MRLRNEETTNFILTPPPSSFKKKRQKFTVWQGFLQIYPFYCIENVDGMLSPVIPYFVSGLVLIVCSKS